MCPYVPIWAQNGPIWAHWARPGPGPAPFPAALLTKKRTFGEKHILLRKDSFCQKWMSNSEQRALKSAACHQKVACRNYPANPADPADPPNPPDPAEVRLGPQLPTPLDSRRGPG